MKKKREIGIKVIVRSLAEKKRVSESEKVQASVYAALLKQSDLDRILASAQTSLNEDQNFYGVRPSLQTNLGDRLKSLEVELTKLISLLGEIGQKGEAALPELQSLSSLVASTEDTIYPFHFKAFDELDVFLNKRISHFESGVSTAEFISDISGRGVGMSAALEMVKSLGGTIEVFSELGKGTKFLLKIPKSADAWGDNGEMRRVA